MKPVLALISSLLYTIPSFAQPPVESTLTAISKYIKLNSAQFAEDGEKYIGVWPGVRTPAGDRTGALVLKYHRRFEYLLNNKTNFQNLYDHLWPDTVKMNKLYIDSISNNKLFVSQFQALLYPLTTTDPFEVPVININKLMQVASRFFYCDGVRADSSISSHICITLNGVKEAKWTEDNTALEAFCFEAIFENYYSSKDVKAKFVQNFVQYIKDGEQRFKGSTADKESYLQSVRVYAFEKMEKDEALKKILLQYFKAHQRTFSFHIETK